MTERRYQKLVPTPDSEFESSRHHPAGKTPALAAKSISPQLDPTAATARDLIRFDTTNFGEGRSNGELEAAEYVAAKLSALGLVPKIYESEPKRASVVARIPGQNANKPALVLHGHLDVVPADPRTWSVDPFAGEVRDGMLWGRGAVDMKNMDAMILTALSDILNSGGVPSREIIVGFFADEEAGGGLGASWLVDNHPDIFTGATEAVSEVGGYSVAIGDTRGYLLQTAEKSLLWVRLVAHGAASHGSRLHHDNAVTKLAEAVSKLGRTEWPITLTNTTRELLSEIARILGLDPETTTPDELASAAGTAASFITATFRTTSNPTKLDAGYKHNVIPDRAEALIDIRTLPGEEEAVLVAVREMVGDDIEVQIIHRDVGLESPTSGAIVDAMTQSLRKYDPSAVVLPYMLSGGTDNKSLSRLGIQGYGFAPLKLPKNLDFPALFHGVDERVPLEALEFGRRVLGDFLRNY